MLKLVCINAGPIPSTENPDKTFNGKGLEEYQFYSAPEQITTGASGRSVYYINEVQGYRLCERFEIIDNFKQDIISHLEKLISEEYKIKK